MNANIAINQNWSKRYRFHSFLSLTFNKTNTTNLFPPYHAIHQVTEVSFRVLVNEENAIINRLL